MPGPRIIPGKGTYILTLEVVEPATVRVGANGDRLFVPGIYLYIGSALGPGGLRARLGRHFSREKRCRWHVDYLVTQAVVRGAFYRNDGVRRECSWAHWFACHTEQTVSSFGASDCSCSSHLFFVGDAKGYTDLATRMEKELEVVYWPRQEAGE